MKKPSLKIRSLALFVVANMLYEIIFPTVAFALTGGPSQPEVQSFEPVGTSDMVDLFSGDFNYNIPLLDVEGYPINIAYHAGIGTDEEASWVGLGWNINPGVVNRGMRGLPDDFKGDEVVQVSHTKPYRAMGLNVSNQFELFSKQSVDYTLGVSLGVKYNNYKGLGLSFGLKPSRKHSEELGSGSISHKKPDGKWEMVSSFRKRNVTETGVDFNFDSQDGMDLEGNFKKYKLEESEEYTGKKRSGQTVSGSKGVSLGFNSRSGIKMTLTPKNTNGVYEKGAASALAGSFRLNNYKTYTPQAKTSTGHFGIDWHMKLGVKSGGPFYTWPMSAYYNAQWDRNKVRKMKAYGSMYHHHLINNPENNKPINDDFLMDYNRHAESGLNKYTKDLPYASNEYDYFSASGQGGGGSFRLKQSFMPVFYDDEVRSYSTDVGGGLNAGVGVVAKMGVDVKLTFSSTRDGVKGFTKKEKDYIVGETNKFEEPVYFKAVGEKNAIDANMYEEENGEKAYDYHQFVDRNKTVGRNERDPRNQVMQWHTVNDINRVKGLGVDEKIYSYPYNNFSIFTSISNPTAPTPLNREKTSPTNLHQISALTVLGDDGRRYVYGIPAMNNSQEECTFSSEPFAQQTNGLVEYDTLPNGRPKYEHENVVYSYNSQTTPSYAYSYLLTGLLSPDYVDVDQNGISPNDYGTAIKFNYTRVHDDFRWRTPLGELKASHQERMKSNFNDDKASIVYGSKEIWYMHSIESKNFVAVFELADRDDGLGVIHFNRKIEVNRKLKKLVSIKLYSRTELAASTTNSPAVPIKTVHFEYYAPNESLCKGIPNQVENFTNNVSSRGKLTLKRIYFTYGNSNKGSYTGYNFTYENNPSYGFKAYDRWGNYAPFVAQSTNPTGAISNAEFPYTSQNGTEADQYAAAWCLSKIDLPSGGIIEINYEADDYAYVQEKKAMQMFKIVGVGKTWNNPTKIVTNNSVDSLPLYYNNFGDRSNGRENFDYIYFKLNNGNDDIQKIVENIDTIYFSNLTLVSDYRISSAKWEQIGGYVALDKTPAHWCGKLSTDNTIGWVKVKNVKVSERGNNNGREIQPMAREGFVFAMQNTPELVYPGSNPKLANHDGGGFSEAVKGLWTSMGEIKTLVRSVYKALQDRGFCRSIMANKSFIRLNNPTGHKKGGGCRVKEIKISDHWNTMQSTNGSDYTEGVYGQQYTYTKVENGRSISSGVASYEPQIGGDENPYRMIRQVMKYKGRFDNIVGKVLNNADWNTLAKREYLKYMLPICEEFYPSASVGYSRVEVKSLGGTTGRTVTEFYTSRDFPTIVKQTPVRLICSDGDSWAGMANLSTKALLTAGEYYLKIAMNRGLKKLKAKKSRVFKASIDVDYDYFYGYQGYTIINNDMNGKMKSQHIFAENALDDNPKSYVKYNYRVTQDSNQLNTVNPSYNFMTNTVSNERLGEDFDINLDKQAENTYVISGSLEFNGDVGASLVMVPTFAINADFSTNDMKTKVITKSINQYALLESTEAFEDGSYIKTSNLLYDHFTGEVLLTETQNEFDDKVYNMTIPAHWTYMGMGQAYRNLNRSEVVAVANDGTFDNSKHSNAFVAGDEVVLTIPGNPPTYKKLWVHAYSDGTKTFWMLIDKDGVASTGGSVTVVRSGRRNMQNIPVGSLVSLENPLKDNGGVLSLDLAFVTNLSKILNASASTYSDDWQTVCSYAKEEHCYGLTTNGTEVKALLKAMITGHHVNENGTPSDPWLSSVFGNNTLCDGTTSTANGYTISNSGDGNGSTIHLKYYNGGIPSDCNIGIALNTGSYKKSHDASYTNYYVTFPCSLEVAADCQNPTPPPGHDLNPPCGGSTPICTLANEQAEIYLYYTLPGDETVRRDPNDAWHTNYLNYQFTNQIITNPEQCAFFDANNDLITSACSTLCTYKITQAEYNSLGNCSTSTIYKHSEFINSSVDDYFNLSHVIAWDENSFQMDENCPGKFKFKVLLNNGDWVWMYGAFFAGVGEPGCLDIDLFNNCCENCSLVTGTKIVNPYLAGTRGNWRKKADYAYHSKRVQSEASGARKPDLRKDGVFASFKPYWGKANSNDLYYSVKDPNNLSWQKASEVTAYNPWGNEIENKDALGIYSAALFAYNYRLPIAVAKNAKYSQIGFEGLEDNDGSYVSVTCPDCHFGLKGSFVNGYLNTDFAHTGNYSLKLEATKTETIERNIKELTTNNTVEIDPSRIVKDGANCIKRFEPEPGKYIIGAWLQEGETSGNQDKVGVWDKYTGAEVMVKLRKSCNDVGITYHFKAAGPVIEGWQRVEGTFEIPSDYRILEVTMVASTTKDSYFDDIRIQPENANMKTYVFDNVTNKLMAELDENNYATFYEYDQEGQLARVKKETVKGVVTLKEVRASMMKN